MAYELRAINDSRKKFYGKAKVREDNGKKTLISYTTEVAYIKDGKAYVNGMYSNTTLRHIKEFLLQNGFNAVNWKQIEKDYCREEEATGQPPEDSNGLGDHMKSVSMVCAFGQLMGGTQKEKNTFDKRMLSTLPGANFPDDWDSLSEDEKTRRLEGAKEQIK